MLISAQSSGSQRTLTPALLGTMWVVLFGFGTFFLSYSTLVPLGERTGLATVAAGTVLTVMMIAVVAIQPVAPLLNKSLGPRLAFLTALGLQATGSVVGFFTQYPLASLLVGSIVGGLGFGVLVVIGTAVVPSTVSPDRVGQALGYFGVATASAAAIGAPAGLWLIDMVSTTDFRWLSFGIVLVALPALWAIPRHQPAHSMTQPPQRKTSGQLPRRIHLGGLISVLLPVALVMTVFGLILAFGPATQDAQPVVYIATMQVFAIFGRFIASASLDRRSPVAAMTFGVVITLLSLSFSAVLSAGWELLVAMLVLGFGVGTVQAASLLLSFQHAGSTNRGSVAWNMTFDIGLGFAGLVGGLGFSLWVPSATYLLCAIALALTALIFAIYQLSQRRPRLYQ